MIKSDNNNEMSDDEIDYLISYLNEAEKRLRLSWLVLIGYAAWMGSSMASVTHRMLFFNSPVKIPLLNIEIALFFFFIVSPLVLLALQSFIVLQWGIINDPKKKFNDKFERLSDNDKDRQRHRLNPGFILFTNSDLAPKGGYNRFFIEVLFIFSFLLLPPCLLIYSQLQFYPYHHFGMSAFHSTLIIISLILSYILVKNIIHRETLLEKSRFISLSILAVFYLFSAFSFIDVPVNRLESIANYLSDHEIVSKYKNLSLVGETLQPFSEAELAERSFSIDLSGRNFDHADFSGADLRKIRIWKYSHINCEGEKNTSFQYANLTNAKLDKANLTCGNFENATLFSDDLQGAVLSSAQMQGAELSEANLNYAYINDTKIDDSIMWNVSEDHQKDTIFCDGLNSQAITMEEYNNFLAHVDDFTNDRKKAYYLWRINRLNPKNATDDPSKIFTCDQISQNFDAAKFIDYHITSLCDINQLALGSWNILFETSSTLKSEFLIKKAIVHQNSSDDKINDEFAKYFFQTEACIKTADHHGWDGGRTNHQDLEDFSSFLYEKLF